MMKRVCLSLALWMLATTTAMASLVIEVGDWKIAPGGVQTFAIEVTGGDLVQGVNLYIQIGDGGWANDGTDERPFISNVDVVGPGTIFHQSNTGQSNAFTSNMLWAVSTTTNTAQGYANHVAADGVLAYVTVDATNVTFEDPEFYPVMLKDTSTAIFPPQGQDTDFAGVPVAITNGTLSPEPMTVILLGLGTALTVRRRK